jgi:hypothetical protein
MFLAEAAGDAEKIKVQDKYKNFRVSSVYSLFPGTKEGPFHLPSI